MKRLFLVYHHVHIWYLTHFGKFILISVTWLDDLMQWSYCILALSHQCDIEDFIDDESAWVRVKQKGRNSLTNPTTISSACEGVAVNSSPPGQNGRHFADNIFSCIFLNENFDISIQISLKFVPKGSINNKWALIQEMAWHWKGDKPISE